MPQLRLALAQVDPTVGDLPGNAALVRQHTARAAADGAHLVAFPEMVLTGYPVEDLKDLSGEEVVYLLFHKTLPTKEETAAFKSDLAKRCVIPPAVFQALRALPKQGHPMEWFLAAINLLGMTSKTGDYREDCLNIIARITSVTAAMATSATTRPVWPAAT